MRSAKRCSNTKVPNWRIATKRFSARCANGNPCWCPGSRYEPSRNSCCHFVVLGISQSCLCRMELCLGWEFDGTACCRYFLVHIRCWWNGPRPKSSQIPSKLKFCVILFSKFPRRNLTRRTTCTFERLPLWMFMSNLIHVWWFLMTKLTTLNENQNLFPTACTLWNDQRVLDEIANQVDVYEHRFGPTDRSDFDGDFIVPAEVRNRVNSSKGSLRIHGGLLTISRSRTFLSLSSGGKSSIHSSTPDLSRSMPNTPGSNHKLSLTSSYDSVLEENEDDGVVVMKKGKGKDKKKKKNGKSHHSSVQHIFPNNVQTRRKSEDLLESRSSPSSTDVSMIAVQRQQQHVRQSSDQAYRLIPRVKKTGFIDGFMSRYNAQSINMQDPSRFGATTSKSTVDLDSATGIEREVSPGRWGNVRGSNSFAADLNISSLSTYTIPRVSLSHHKLHDETHEGAPRKSLPENRVSSTFIMRHNTDDSTA